ncbi:MAG: response regulator [Chloroflexia bacterium]|nr:response regulator [Chloroflexia bacterium]
MSIAFETNPDLIISDIMMPVMNGYEMTRKLKQNELSSHIPIIMLTAKASEESLLQGFECEADDYLTKPFNANELNARVTNLIKIREKLIAKFKKTISVVPSEITTTSADESFLRNALKIVEENIMVSDFSVEDFIK